jgi:hypothetical protein
MISHLTPLLIIITTHPAASYWLSLLDGWMALTGC